MGKLIQPNQHTRFQLFKLKVKLFIKRVLKIMTWSSFVGLSIYLSYIAGQFSVTKIVFADNQEDIFTKKVDMLKADVVNQLKSCESNGYKEKDGLIVFDTNQKPSIGKLQFQVKTVVYYYSKLYGKTITNKEAIEIALDESKASDLAKDILFKVDNGSGEWFNCSKKLGLQNQINIINKLK